MKIGIEFSDHGKTWKIIEMEYPINKDFPKKVDGLLVLLMDTECKTSFILAKKLKEIVKT